VSRTQLSLADGASPAAEWDRDLGRRAIDALFSLARHDRSGSAYRQLIGLVQRTRWLTIGQPPGPFAQPERP
jgi:hypothetical protein